MSANLKNAVIFGVGLAIGLALGNSALTWTKSALS